MLFRNGLKRSALLTFTALAISGAALSGCNSSGADVASAGAPAQSIIGGSTTTSTNGPVSIPVGTRKFSTDVLLYDGDGAWAAEVTNLENLFSTNNITYQAVTSSQLNGMTLAQISDFGAIIWPGGQAGTQASSLTSQTMLNLRTAVQQNGVSFLGFCAGSFIAVEPAATVTSNPIYGMEIVDAPGLQYYYLENQGIDIQQTMETFPDGSSHDVLWYGGPVTMSGANTVIAKYPTGEPAISQVWSGNGLVILSGVHPTASSATLQALGQYPSDGDDQALAVQLINAVVHQAPMQTFAN